MQSRQLQKVGIEVSEIGFGTWGLGGDAYGPTDDAESIKTLHKAFELGVTFYDTSDLYGSGHAETILGQALSTHRKDIIISTKGGLLPHKTFEMPKDFSVEHMKNALQASLNRMQTDYADIYFLHSPTLEDLEKEQETLEWLLKSKEEGLIRAIGLSARSPADALDGLRLFPFDVVQVNYNMIDLRAIECGLFDYCLETGTGVVGRTPLCFGYLTGQFTGEKAELVASHDHRAKWPEAQLKCWANSPGLFEKFHGDNSGRTAAQLALSFCLAHPAVTTTIPGMLTAAQVEENVKASSLPPLTEEELAEIQSIYEQNSFFDPTAKKD